MWIREVELKNFGKFREKRILLSQGINLVYGENESGKSTIYTGIKSILFGMTRGRGRLAKTDTFSQYEPWEEPNYYVGVIRFSSEGRNFVLARNFDKYGKSTRLFCEDDGEELSIEAGDLEVLLEEMDEAEFENTVSIGQMKVETNESLASAIKNYAANYFSTGDSEIDLTKALGFLKERKKDIDREIRELQRRKQEKRDKLELEASYIWKDLRSLEKEKEHLLEEVRVSRQKIDALDEKERVEREEQEERGHNWVLHPGVLVGMVICIVAVLFFIPKPWNYFSSVVIILAEVLFIWNKLKDSKRKQAEAREEEREELTELLERQEWQLERLEEEYQDKRISHLNLKEQIDELDEVGNEFKEQQERRQAVELAEEMILRSAKEMQVHLEEKINKRVSKILSELTDGKYEKVWIDDAFRLNIYSDGRKILMEQVSRGTIEQLYFALRMAAVEIMHSEEYPVILDDAFVFYDEMRLEAVLRWLKKNRRQVILFTCQKREEELLRKNGIVFNRIII